MIPGLGHSHLGATTTSLSRYFNLAQGIRVSVNKDAAKQLGSDHALVGINCLIGRKQTIGEKPRRPRFSGCRRAMVDDAQLRLHLPILSSAEPHPHAQWEALKKVSSRCCYPRPRIKFQDSQGLKELCRERQLAPTLQERNDIFRLILARRAAEKREWWQALEERAGAGDAQAILYLRRRQVHKADASPLVSACGGRSGAVSAVKGHFARVMAVASPEELQKCAELHADLRAKAEMTELQPFTPEEVRSHVAKYTHRNKTSGPSGIPNEIISALASDDEGVDFLCQHLTMMVVSNDDIPLESLNAFICLVPKQTKIKFPKDYRPISLLEATSKLCGGLLFRRWLRACSIPRAQQGCLPGYQTVTSLYLAQSLFYKEYRLAKPSLWLLLDVQQAFDSLKRSKLLEYLLTGPPELSKEASTLYQLIRARLAFRWGNEDWTMISNTGIQQGAPPSAGLFGLILGETLDALFHAWDETSSAKTDHTDSKGDPLHGWAFADDVILTFSSWSDFRVGFEQLIHAFRELGLEINLSKSVLVVHEDLLEGGLRYFSRYPNHPNLAVNGASMPPIWVGPSRTSVMATRFHSGS